ncbi:MAG: TIM barrel protein [Roseiflexaceae bacterium]|nr:TIM barrel protein [Roseiflexaceae bacterium]
MTIQIGCAANTWNHSRFTHEQILAEIASAGYAGAPAGPAGDATPESTLALFERYGLRPAPAYFGGNFWRAEESASILASAHRFAAFARAVGCDALYVAANGFEGYTTRRGLNRKQIAGQVTTDDALTDREFTQLAATLNEFGALTLEHGVRSCFHNHVGSVIESGGEIERLLASTDPELVFLGPDTGHLAWADVDPVAFVHRHASRIKTVHLKDVNQQVRRAGVAAGWEYDAFTEQGIFNELGQGDIDFPAILSVLQQANFSGWLIAETDVTQRPTALESATVSRQYLASLGL